MENSIKWFLIIEKTIVYFNFIHLPGRISEWPSDQLHHSLAVCYYPIQDSVNIILGKGSKRED